MSSDCPSSSIFHRAAPQCNVSFVWTTWSAFFASILDTHGTCRPSLPSHKEFVDKLCIHDVLRTARGHNYSKYSSEHANIESNIPFALIASPCDPNPFPLALPPAPAM